MHTGASDTNAMATLSLFIEGLNDMGGDFSSIADPFKIIQQSGPLAALHPLAQRQKKQEPAPLPAVPTRDDPAILAAREKLRLSEQRRRGRAATNLTGGLGATDVFRPVARTAQLLGE